MLIIVYFRLFSDLVNDSLTEFAYDADLAGLSYNFSPHSTGLFITMNGYNDKLSVLVRHVIEKVKDITVDSKRLDVVKEEVSISIVSPIHAWQSCIRLVGNGKTFSSGSRIPFPTGMRDIYCQSVNGQWKKNLKSLVVSIKQFTIPGNISTSLQLSLLLRFKNT